MTIKKIKYRRLYDISLFLIILVLLYVIVTHTESFPVDELLTLIFLAAAGKFALIRSYQLDKLRRINTHQELVDFWLYYNQTSPITFFVNYFFVYPLRHQKSHDDNVKLIKTINLFTYLTYISFALFMLTFIAFKINLINM